MQVVVFASAKGGVSKTTLSVNQSVQTELMGHRCVLLDYDPQQSAAQWWQTRDDDLKPAPDMAAASVSALPAKLEELRSAGVHERVYIDTPPSDVSQVGRIVASADLVLIPCKPSIVDLNSVQNTVRLVKEAGKPFAFLVTQGQAGTRSLLEITAALSEFGPVCPTVMHHRVDYSACMNDGRTVMELAPQSKAAQEMQALAAYIDQKLAGDVRPKTSKPRSRALV